MTPKRWQQVDQLFHSALGRESGEQAAFLAQACGDDDSLRREVESLLASHAKAENFIETPAGDVAAELFAVRETRLTTGESVGHYQIISLLGEGGMGEVYLARDTRLGRQVALKRLPEQFTLDPERVHRFEQEARAASALNHPNIVTIHEIEHLPSLHFIATEFIDGETLRQRLASRMKIDEVLDVATQIASALAAAHAAGIVHRDIKPENVMLRRDRLVKVLDFGLAKLASPELAAATDTPARSTVKTNPGMVMGTVRYMSPEQARGDDVDARSDIWSLGVVLYEMVTSRVPFEGETPSHVIVSLMDSEPLALTHYSPVPVELERIVTRALRKNKVERYQTASELVFDLNSLKKELEVDGRLKQSFEPETLGAAETFAGGTPATLSINAHRTSGAQHLLGKIRRHQRVVRTVLVALAAFAIVTAAYLAYSRYWPAGRKANVDSAAGIRSIAVLPFTNATGNPDAEYLSDGVSESLINSLSALPGVKVIARTSSFKYKGTEVDPQEVARALGVEAVLTGRIAQRDDSLSISVALVDGHDGTQVWGQRYNRKAADLVAVQSEISSEIARMLRVHLTTFEQQNLAKRENVNFQAYELQLKGRFSASRGGTENRKKAIEYFNQAIAVEPTYALAYAQLSLSYSSLINSNLLDPKEFTPKAEAAARKALELDESLAQAHLAMGGVSSDAWDWAAAEREIKLAIELNPNLAPAHSDYAYYLTILGRPDQAIAEFKRASQLDPLSPTANQAVVYGLLAAHQNDQAIEAAKQMLGLDHTNPDLHILLGVTYARKGQYREAIEAYREGIRLGADSPDELVYLGAAYAQAGERDKTRAILKRLATRKEYISPVGLAILHGALGEREQAFALLERAYASHDQQLIWLGVDGDFVPMRSDPRFQDLMRRIGLSA